MLLSRARFFLCLLLLLPGPFIGAKLLWLAGTQKTKGMMSFVGHDGLGSTLGISTYPVIGFQLGKDTILFHGMQGLGYRPGDAVPVRYRVNHPEDAKIDLPICIWGDTLVYLLLPLGVWLVLLLTPESLDPLVPRRSKVLLRWRRPYIKIIPQLG